MSFGENSAQEKWRVRVIDTGLECQTGGRIARAFDAISVTDDFKDFAVTYGDGLSDVNLDEVRKFHGSHGKIGTVLGVHPIARFGELEIDAENSVKSFQEKPQSRVDWINGGFFFFKNGFREFLSDAESTVLERAPLENLAKSNGMSVFKHTGFWQPMDTLRDKNLLQSLWDSKEAPWVPKDPRS